MRLKGALLTAAMTISASGVCADPLNDDGEYRYLYFSIKVARAELAAAHETAKAKMWLAYYEMQRDGLSEPEAKRLSKELLLSESEIEVARSLIKYAQDEFDRYKQKHYPQARPYIARPSDKCSAENFLASKC